MSDKKLTAAAVSVCLSALFVNKHVHVITLGVWSSRCHWIHGRDGEVRRFLPHDQEIVVRNVIEPMASNGLRTICLAYKEFVTGTDLHLIKYVHLNRKST